MRRKPQKEKQLTGTYRPDRRGRVAAEAQTNSQVPRMPAGLTPEVQRAWRRVVPALAEHGLQPVDTTALVDLCVCLVRLGEAEAAITEHGVVVMGYRGSLVKNPAVSIAASYRQALQKWADRFGLTPGARAKLILPEPEDPPPPLSAGAIPWSTAIKEFEKEQKS